MSFYARGKSPLVPPDNRRQTEFKKPSLTQQHHANDVNINKIIERFNKTGVLGDGLQRRGNYADVSLFGDFGECQRRIEAARESFASLPVQVKKLAGNDPSRLWDVLNNPENRQLLEKAGVLKTPEKPVPPPGDGQSAQKPS